MMSTTVLYVRHASQSTRCFGTTASVTKFDFPRIRNEVINRWMQEQASSENSGSKRVAMYYNCTYNDSHRLYAKDNADWHWLDRELSSNVAGETGAIAIYDGALAAMSLRSYPEEARSFALEHRSNEASHLQLLEYIVPANKHTRLLPMWKAAGFVLGFVPTFFGGQRSLFLTVEAVETFVEEHYQSQIGPLIEQGGCDELVKLLQQCCEDEVHHKEDARRRLLGDTQEISNNEVKDVSLGLRNQPISHRIWSKIVRIGSEMAADVARRI
eukprot:scaffold69809_cov42-Attheya_sp.AAC.1